MGQWWSTVWHDFSEVPFWAMMIVRLFPRRFFHGPTVVNGMRVPLDMKNSKKKVYGKYMLIQLFYTLYFICMEKKVK